MYAAGVSAKWGVGMDFQHQTAHFVNASWALVKLRDTVYEMVGLLFTELDKNGGMAGDDPAGRAFAAVYTPAVKTLFDHAGYAHQVMANGAGTLLLAAEKFLKQDSKVAASLLRQSPSSPPVGPQPMGPECDSHASHSAEDLSDVVGKTSWHDQYLLNKRFHGQRDKLRSVAKSWRSAAHILEDAYWDSNTAWQTATLEQVGETADAAHSFFTTFVGKTAPPSSVAEGETLLANLPAACRMLARACDAYADHIDTALQRIPEEDDPLFGDPQMPWEKPLFGGGRA